MRQAVLRKPIWQVVVCVVAGAGVARAADAPGEARFLDRYLCPVGEMVAAIRGAPWRDEDEQNRFLILYPKGREGAYAQCAFYDKGLSVHCEIASPFYALHNPSPDIARKPAVARLGYDLDDSKGNYVREFKLDAADAPPLAEFMLRSLYEAFLDSDAVALRFQAPLVKTMPAGEACAPNS